MEENGMEMEMEVVDGLQASDAVVERLHSAAEMLEAAVAKLSAMELQASAVEQRLSEAESALAAMKNAPVAAGGRKTVATLAAKHEEAQPNAVGAVDAALASLSVEQRIAVKAGLLRSGLL